MPFTPGRHLAALVGLLGMLLSGCHGSETPEDQVRATLHRAQQAVTDGDLGVLTELISDDYADEAGRDRPAVVALLRKQFIESRTIHLLTRVQEVAMPEAGRAEATILVASGEAPLPDADDLSTLKADLYRFEIALTEEEPGRWIVVRAAWRRMGAGGLM